MNDLDAYGKPWDTRRQAPQPRCEVWQVDAEGHPLLPVWYLANQRARFSSSPEIPTVQVRPSTVALFLQADKKNNKISTANIIN